MNGTDPVDLNEVTTGDTVILGYDLHLPEFIDSVQIAILSPKQEVEISYVYEAPWKSGNNTASIIFPLAGTKTCVITCFNNDGTQKNASLIFVVSYQPGNRAPVWSPDTVELTSQKGSTEQRSLLPYSNDPDGNPISFEIIPPNIHFTVQDSFITADAVLLEGVYPIKVILSDGELQDTGTLIWNIFIPQSEHAIVRDDSAETTVDNQIIINVLSNDSSASSTLVLSSVTQPENGIAAIRGGMVIFIPDSGFTGTDNFNYVVNSMDTGRVIVTVTNETTGHTPQITVTGDRVLQPMQTCSLTIQTSDEDTDQILSVTMTGNPDDAVLIGDTLFIWEIPGDYIGEQTVTFIVTDNGEPPRSDSSAVIITVTTASDMSPPVMKLTNPVADSTSVNDSSATVSIEVTDESDIASVTASFKNTELSVSEVSPVYSVTVTGLSADQFNTIRFVATDASANGNTETLYVTIKYDPTMDDVTSPVFRQISGPLSGSIITNPAVMITDSITDPSGVDSVYWSINGGASKQLSTVSGKPDLFVLSDTLTREHFDTILVTAVDNSIRRNRSTQRIILNYLIPPRISDQSDDPTVCAGTPVTLSVTAAGTTPLTYQWRSGSGGDETDIPGATGTEYEFTPDAGDNGTVFTCLVSNGSGEDVVSEPVTLTVSSASTKPGAVAEPATICSGESTALSVSAGTLGTGASWLWYAAKSSSTPLTSQTVSPTSGRWYYVKGTGGLCEDSPWDSVYVTVNTASVAATEITASTTTVCSGNEVTLTVDGGTLGTNAAWQWFINEECTQSAVGIPNADGSQIVVEPDSTTTYYVRASGTCNVTDVVSRTVTVHTVSTAPTGISSNSTSICHGSSVTLTQSGGSLGTNATWAWYTDSIFTQATVGTPNTDGSQITVAPATQTTYYVRAESSCGNTNEARRTISVNTPPVLEPLAGGEICEPSEYTSGDYSISATGNSPFSYQWFTSDGMPLGTGSFVYVPAPAAGVTQFYCVVTDVNGCSAISNTATQTAHQPTVITRQPAGDVGYIEFGDRFEDTVTATGDDLNYEWQCQQPDGNSWVSMGTGSTISIHGLDIPGWFPAAAGVYDIPVRVEITNKFGCEKFSDTVNFKVYY